AGLQREGAGLVSIMRSRIAAMAAAAIVVAATAGIARSAVTVECTVVVGPDLKRQAGRLAALDATHVQIARVDGRQGIEVPLADLVWIELNNGASRVANGGNVNPSAPPRPSRRPPPARTDLSPPDAADVPARQATQNGDFLI